VVAWSLAAIAHAFARTANGFSIARAALGLGESANFPASIKAVAEWFPQKERALATGIFNAGSNVGAILTPLIVPWITLTYGWQAAFIVTGSLGFLWLIVWLAVTAIRRTTETLGAEASHPSGQQEVLAPPGWGALLSRRQTWAFALGKFMTDPIWWFYLFWLPKFLDSGFGVKLSGLAAPLVTIYLIADVGSVGGGWLSSSLIKRGWSVNAGRKLTMLIAALLIVPTMLAPQAHNMWVAVGIVSVAAAAHQWWSANLFTTVSDMFRALPSQLW
jgi:ACS family hexuronate transporter-like MFS transporter